jgi:hypothetical protein
VICVLVLDDYRDTIDSYLQIWARSLNQKVRSIAYESLRPQVSLAGSTFIFSDVERLTDQECERAAAIASKIKDAGARVLNCPSKALRRYSLLRALHTQGLNPFNVYREAEIDEQIRFPVFVRRDRAHDGPQTPLLNDRDELMRAMSRLKSARPAVDDWLVVEYAHTVSGADGLFRKYSAMRIGEALIPRHILFSREWVDKNPDIVNEASVQEESEFQNNFPHAEEVRRIFDIANIEYGRIDYSLVDGRLVTWEINTNPVLIVAPEKCHPLRFAGQVRSAKLIREALGALDDLKTRSIGVAGCQPVIDQSCRRKRRRLLFAAVDFWVKLDRFKMGRRLADAVARSLRLAKDVSVSRGEGK